MHQEFMSWLLLSIIGLCLAWKLAEETEHSGSSSPIQLCSRLGHARNEDDNVLYIELSKH